MTVPWHTMETHEVIGRLRTDYHRGLTEPEAARRLERNGPNVLEKEAGPGVIEIFAGQFKNSMVLLLLFAAGVALCLGETADALAIMVIVVANALLGFVQEYRAERALEALAKMSAPQAKLIREGCEKSIPSEEVVPGDVVILEAGDRVPGDVRLIEAFGLEADESALTGESFPVRKSAESVENPKADLGDRPCMTYFGTVITRGRARGVVVATGMETEIGKIARMLQESERELTPLQTRLEELGRLLALGCILICGVVAASGMARGEPAFRMFLMGVSLAVAAIPEGLPAVVTVALAVGVKRMTAKAAIVRKLPAVETLGCATVICSDKTGTLTQNVMTVREIWADGMTFHIEGVGWDPSGRLFLEGRSVRPRENTGLMLTLLAGVLCNNSKIQMVRHYRRRGAHNGWQVWGDPTEAALLVAGERAGLDLELLVARCVRIAENPFESSRRMMSVVCEDPKGRVVYAKGAVETILEKCSFILTGGRVFPLSTELRQQVLKQAGDMADRALRVLAFAVRKLERYTGADPEEDMTFVGLSGMFDPPRPEVIEAVARCRAAGVRTVMITGDHPGTAKQVALEIGLYDGDSPVVTGGDLDAMDDRELLTVAATATVYARVTPLHKLRLVRALKRLGHVVAMTGDGVNDAPAVREADIGISMGLTGTEVTKEASCLVLADDNFATIVRAVEEGRAIYDNIRKFIRYLLACNVGEVLVMFLGALVGAPMPLIPIQILWVNLMTDGLPAVALGLDGPEPDVMNRKPRPPGEGIFAGRLGIKVLTRGILIGVTTLLVFLWKLDSGASLVAARTHAFAVLVMCQLFHVFDCRSERRTPLEVGLFSNPLLLLAVASSAGLLLAAIYSRSLQAVFQTQPLGLEDWAVVIGASAIGSILVTFRRRILRVTGAVSRTVRMGRRHR
ncbi:MAG: calcium-translocating P-type ATPase, SERCA-type [Bacillota bacterium]